MILLIARRDKCDLIFQEAITFMLCLAPIASKAGQQLPRKASLFGFVLAFAWLFFHFAHRRSEEEARKQPHGPPVSPFKNLRQRLSSPGVAQRTLQPHTLPDTKKLYPNRTLVHIHRHTRNKQKNETLIVTGGFFYGQILHV